MIRLTLLFLASLTLAGSLVSCGSGEGEAALDSDANGFFCAECKSKFYTDRKVFANHCPDCKKANIELVVGFVCAADQHTTYGPRGKGALACEKCRKLSSNLVIPRETELKTWGASRRSAAAVGVEL